MAETLAEALHWAWIWQYDECDHGTYSGGTRNGQPYKMCEILAKRVEETWVRGQVEHALSENILSAALQSTFHNGMMFYAGHGNPPDCLACRQILGVVKPALELVDESHRMANKILRERVDRLQAELEELRSRA